MHEFHDRPKIEALCPTSPTLRALRTLCAACSRQRLTAVALVEFPSDCQLPDDVHAFGIILIYRLFTIEDNTHCYPDLSN